jgi:RNA polymerase sigma factor (sigma-70 family)
MAAMHENCSDEDLIALFYNCDDGAFAALERSYTRRLYRFFSKLGIREDYEDCTQLVWLKISRTKYTGGGRFDPSHNCLFVSWLFTIAHNVARDYWKRRPPTVAPPQTDQGTDDWERLLSSDDPRQFEDLYDCIARLEDPCRSVVELILAGFILEEIGDKRGVSLATAYEYKRRAVEKLRACLADRGHSVVAGAESAAKRQMPGGADPSARKGE